MVLLRHCILSQRGDTFFVTIDLECKYFGTDEETHSAAIGDVIPM